METFVIGTSEATEAEYGSYSDEQPVTILQLWDGEVAQWYGYKTIAAARASLKKDGIPASQISYL
jgi:hypothetical protein